MKFTATAYDKPFRLSLFFICLSPSCYLFYGYINNTLGINPFATLIQMSGHMAMLFIIITLAITPLRRWLTYGFRQFPKLQWGKRLSDWNILISSRRMLGIYAFYYATLHLWVYCYLEMDFYWPDMYLAIIERHFMLFGLASWVCLLLLAITSPHAIQRRMRRWWRRLHRLMYILPVLAAIHYYLAVKITNQQPIIYFIIIFILLFHRVLVARIRYLRRYNDNGMEVSRR
ncbi:MAG: ferric reductase-like transmembrane domain-containing protein [Cellvibrionaceae bacterium]|nr:ferric reductase-like transmembrane domain-containing protein [Cellvibrionaceae bacterium]